jgi:hypothetical protein
MFEFTGNRWCAVVVVILAHFPEDFRDKLIDAWASRTTDVP